MSGECPWHPPHASLASVWCARCDVYKVDGVYRVNEGQKSLVSILVTIGAQSIAGVECVTVTGKKSP